MRNAKLITRICAALAFAEIATGCAGGGAAFAPAGTSASQSAEAVGGLQAIARRVVSRNTMGSLTGYKLSLAPSNMPLELHPSWMRLRAHDDGATKDIVWATNFGFPVPIGEYAVPNESNNGPLCEAPGAYGVNLLGTDPKGNLWVPTTGPSGTPGEMYVQEYSCSGSFGPSVADANGEPADVAFDSKGNTYVGNNIDYWWTNFGCCYIVSGTVNIYNASGTLIGNLTDPSFFAPHPPGFDTWNQLVGVAVDADDNCYVSHQDDTGGGEVVEFPGCKPANHGKILAGPHPWEPGKPEFDAAGNLLVTDWAASYYYRVWYLSVYAPPYDGPAIKTFPMYGPALTCPLSSDQTRLYCGNFWNGTVDVYSYKAGKYLYSFNNGLQTYGVEGVAVAPAGSR